MAEDPRQKTTFDMIPFTIGILESTGILIANGITQAQAQSSLSLRSVTITNTVIEKIPEYLAFVLLFKNWADVSDKTSTLDVQFWMLNIYYNIAMNGLQSFLGFGGSTDGSCLEKGAYIVRSTQHQPVDPDTGRWNDNNTRHVYEDKNVALQNAILKLDATDKALAGLVDAQAVQVAIHRGAFTLQKATWMGLLLIVKAMASTAVANKDNPSGPGFYEIYRMFVISLFLTAFGGAGGIIGSSIAHAAASGDAVRLAAGNYDEALAEINEHLSSETLRRGLGAGSRTALTVDTNYVNGLAKKMDGVQENLARAKAAASGDGLFEDCFKTHGRCFDKGNYPIGDAIKKREAAYDAAQQLAGRLAGIARAAAKKFEDADQKLAAILEKEMHFD